jgi:hypothetical protein
MKRELPTFRHAKWVEGAVAVLIVIPVIVAVLMTNSGSDVPQAAAAQAATEPAALPADNSTPLPYKDVTLRSSTPSPSFSQQDAMQIVKAIGVPWALGGNYEGQQVNVSAHFGIGTLGHADPTEQVPWVGPQHVPIKGTDIVLDHVADRPMWILDYGNVAAYGSQIAYNHAVYVVDEQSRTLLITFFYHGS